MNALSTLLSERLQAKGLHRSDITETLLAWGGDARALPLYHLEAGARFEPLAVAAVCSTLQITEAELRAAAAAELRTLELQRDAELADWPDPLLVPPDVHARWRERITPLRRFAEAKAQNAEDGAQTRARVVRDARPRKKREPDWRAVVRGYACDTWAVVSVRTPDDVLPQTGKRLKELAGENLTRCILLECGADRNGSRRWLVFATGPKLTPQALSAAAVKLAATDPQVTGAWFGRRANGDVPVQVEDACRALNSPAIVASRRPDSWFEALRLNVCGYRW